jgi:hypothetical protein
VFRIGIGWLGGILGFVVLMYEGEGRLLRLGLMILWLQLCRVFWGWIVGFHMRIGNIILV